MKNAQINFSEKKSLWDAFVSTSPQRSIFAYSKFLDSLRVNYDLVTLYDGAKIVAGTVVIYGDDGAPRNSAFPFTLYQGVLLSDNSEKHSHTRITYEFKAVEFFIAQLASHYKQNSFCHSWHLQDLRPFMWHNYHEPFAARFSLDLRYTCVLDLGLHNSFDSYLATVRAVRRQEFRKAEKSMELYYSDDVILLDQLHAKTFERQGLVRESYESELLQSICRQAITGGYGKMAVAKLDGVPVSAVLFLYDDRTAYYLFGANDPLYRNHGGGTFLLMKIIEDAFGRGVHEVDFVGVNSPNRGDYKISFNAELRPYFITNITPGE